MSTVLSPCINSNNLSEAVSPPTFALFSAPAPSKSPTILVSSNKKIHVRAHIAKSGQLFFFYLGEGRKLSGCSSLVPCVACTSACNCANCSNNHATPGKFYVGKNTAISRDWREQSYWDAAIAVDTTQVKQPDHFSSSSTSKREDWDGAARVVNYNNVIGDCDRSLAAAKAPRVRLLVVIK